MLAALQHVISGVEMTKPEIHIGIISFPGLGHIMPILQFAKMLAAAEDLVRVEIFTLICEADLSKIPDNLNERTKIINMPTECVCTGSVESMAQFAVDELNGSHSKFIKSYYADSRDRPSIVVNGMLVCTGSEVAKYFRAHLWAFNASPLVSLTICALDAGRASAHRQSAQDIRLYTNPTAMTRVGGMPPYLICSCQSGCHKKKEEAYLCPVMGPILYEDMPVLPPKSLDMHEMFNRSFKLVVEEAEYILCNDVTAFNIPNSEGLTTSATMIEEYARDPIDGVWGASLMKRARNIGPLCAMDTRVGGNKSEKMIMWLNAQEPKSVVYVALGSWGELSPANLYRLAEGLEKSGKAILWALRGKKPIKVSDENLKEDRFNPLLPSAKGSEDRVGEVDDLGLPVGWLERMGNRAFVAPWMNQLDVLTSSALGCFVTHCGWNSILEAVTYSEAPLIGLPLGAEQAMNSRLIQEVFHNGLRIRKTLTEKVDSNVVAVSIETVMGNKRFTLNAQRLHRLAFSQFGAGVEELKKILKVDGFPSI